MFVIWHDATMPAVAARGSSPPWRRRRAVRRCLWRRWRRCRPGRSPGTHNSPGYWLLWTVDLCWSAGYRLWIFYWSIGMLYGYHMDIYANYANSHVLVPWYHLYPFVSICVASSMSGCCLKRWSGRRRPKGQPPPVTWPLSRWAVEPSRAQYLQMSLYSYVIGLG